MVEKEEANFDTEISEDDVVGEWKLRGQVLSRTPVRPDIMPVKHTQKKNHLSEHTDPVYLSETH